MAAKWSGEKINLKRRNVKGALQEISTPKIMCLPPQNFIGSENIFSLFGESGLHALTLQQLNDAAPNMHPSNDVILHQDVDTSEQPDESFTEAEQIEEYAAEENEPEHDEEAEEADDDRAHQNVHDPALCCVQCREERHAFETLVLRKMNRLLELAQSERPGRRDGIVSLLPPMPFIDTAALTTFDNNLKQNEEMRKQFREKIQEIGGKNVQKAVRYSLETIIADDLAQKVVWVLGSDEKPKLSKYEFPRIIIEVIRSSFRDATIKEIENRIADWLRRGGDRLKVAKAASKNRSA